MFNKNEDDSRSLLSDSKQTEITYSGHAPDARLTCFLTGILLSEPVRAQLNKDEDNSLRCSLFEGWCIGLLSASIPWRMISAFTAAGILNTCPMALDSAARRVPLVDKYIRRLESAVLRRMWAERASSPGKLLPSHVLLN